MIFQFDIKSGNLYDPDQDFTLLKQAIRNVANLKGIDDENLPTFRYFQIKKSVNYNTDYRCERFTFQFIDVSSKVLYDDIKAQEEFSSLMTSTISHEMRNPLNSIVN